MRRDGSSIPSREPEPKSGRVLPVPAVSLAGPSAMSQRRVAHAVSALVVVRTRSVPPSPCTSSLFAPLVTLPATCTVTSCRVTVWLALRSVALRAPQVPGTFLRTSVPESARRGRTRGRPSVVSHSVDHLAAVRTVVGQSLHREGPRRRAASRSRSKIGRSVAGCSTPRCPARNETDAPGYSCIAARARASRLSSIVSSLSVRSFGRVRARVSIVTIRAPRCSGTTREPGSRCTTRDRTRACFRARSRRGSRRYGSRPAVRPPDRACVRGSTAKAGSA